jgi:hypothetical protein
MGPSAADVPSAMLDPDADDAAGFDDLDDEDNESDVASTGQLGQQHAAAAAAGDEVPLPENRPICLPSNSRYHAAHRPAELKLRLTQADTCLQALRDAIADKSFQYSHIIRVAPRKSINTRARATIAKLNYKIAYHARVYARSRQAIAALDADDVTLLKYPILLKEHLRSSSALLDPNQPGSTRIQLSWIWKTADGGSHQTPEALQECELPHSFCQPLRS